jgi:hypothetical protein
MREDGSGSAAGASAAAAAASDKKEAVKENSRVELLIVGPTGVGKSSLLRHLRDGSFLEETDSTIGLDYEQVAQFPFQLSMPYEVLVFLTHHVPPPPPPPPVPSPPP